MNWKDFINNNMVLRNMAGDLFGRAEYSHAPGGFTPYFRYKIGRKQNDYFLYFPKEPFLIRYYNEFFNKLSGLMGSDIYKYIEFHWNSYTDKPDFLRFLRYELSYRLKKKLSSTYKQKYQTAMEWVLERQTELQDKFREKIDQEQQQLKQELETGVHAIVLEKQATESANTDQQTKILVEKLSAHIDQIMKTTETGLTELTSSFTTGNIELNNRNHEERIVQLLILLQEVQAPSSLQKGEQLFKKFSDTDIAAILKLHFAAFKDRKINTLQRRVGDKGDVLNYKSPKVQQLIQALEEFFYH